MRGLGASVRGGPEGAPSGAGSPEGARLFGFETDLEVNDCKLDSLGP